MGYYEPGICVDSFEPDPDGLIRVRRYDVEGTFDVGETITITDDELMGFARVVSYEGDVFTGYICLEELHGEEAEQASAELARPYDHWCDPLHD
jgi:hypothetical protein